MGHCRFCGAQLLQGLPYQVSEAEELIKKRRCGNVAPFLLSGYIFVISKLNPTFYVILGISFPDTAYCAWEYCPSAVPVRCMLRSP